MTLAHRPRSWSRGGVACAERGDREGGYAAFYNTQKELLAGKIKPNKAAFKDEKPILSIVSSNKLKDSPKKTSWLVFFLVGASI